MKKSTKALSGYMFTAALQAILIRVFWHSSPAWVLVFQSVGFAYCALGAATLAYGRRAGWS